MATVVTHQPQNRYLHKSKRLSMRGQLILGSTTRTVISRISQSNGRTKPGFVHTSPQVFCNLVSWGEMALICLKKSMVFTTVDLLKCF